MKLLRPLPLALALATLFAGSAQAQNLVQMYEAARGYDAGYQSARAQYDASIAKADQATAAILPTVSAAAGYSQTQFDNKTGNSIVIDTSFGTENASIAASQPLYRPANLATYEQGRKQVDIAKAQLDAIEQDLIVRVSSAYFDVLSAQDNLFLVREQKKFVAEQLASAKRNFEVGTATITDSREAESRYDLILAAEIGAENDLRVKRLALEVVVGKAGNDPKPLARPVVLPAIPLTDDAFWVNQAVVSNPTLRQARLGVDVAQLETAKAYAGHKPTLDLTASYGNTRYPGGNSTSGFYTRTTAGTVGLALNIPIFSGFFVQNQVKQTLALEEKAKADLDGVERNVVQGHARHLFRCEVRTGPGQGAGNRRNLDQERAGRQHPGLPGGRAHQPRRAELAGRAVRGPARSRPDALQRAAEQPETAPGRRHAQAGRPRPVERVAGQIGTPFGKLPAGRVPAFLMSALFVAEGAGLRPACASGPGSPAPCGPPHPDARPQTPLPHQRVQCVASASVASASAARQPAAMSVTACAAPAACASSAASAKLKVCGPITTGQPQAAASIRFCPPRGAKLPPSSATSLMP